LTPRRRALLEALRDEDSAVRRSASEALDQVDLLEGFPEFRERLRSFGKAELIRFLGSLRGVRDLECLKLALRCLTHPEEDVRVAALGVAEAHADWRASATIAARLSDPSPLVRARALEVLGNLGDRRRAADVAPLLRDPDPRVIAAAADALGGLADGKVESLLLPLLSHPQAAVRASAARALGRLSLSSDGGAPSPDASGSPAD
jgi:HEAT repeat protein